MASAKQYLNDWLRWRSGRQETGYEKLLLLANSFVLPFDCYLLRYRKGAEIPEHTDPVTDKKHYRLNVVLKHARDGGEFVCSDPIFERSRIKIFRPDQSPHGVSRVNDGTRYVFSLGWVRR